MGKKKAYSAVAAGAAALVGSMVAAVPAHAGGGDFTEESGTCAMSSTWDMKAKPDTGKVEMEFSVDTVRLGQAWKIRLTDNGKFLWAGRRISHGVSKSFSVRETVREGRWQVQPPSLSHVPARKRLGACRCPARG
jgi:hypothetical protein